MNLRFPKPSIPGLLTSLLVGGFCLHCAPAAEGPASDVPIPDDAVAAWTGGHVTAAELERRILELAPEARRPEDGDFTAWHAELAREAAVERLLAADARDAGLLEDPKSVAALENVEAEVLAEAYLARHLPAARAVSEEDVRELFEARREELARPAQRLVLHLFLRREGELTSDDALRSRLLELRQRVEGGENFQLVARAHSQSETRHRNGVMGNFIRGQLPPDLDRLVFDLPVKSTSQPVLTPQGGHLFWIETAIEERRLELVELRPRLMREIQRSRLAEAIDALALDRDLPEGSYLPSDDALETLAASGDPRALVLRLGTTELYLGELQERLVASGADGRPPIERARELVESVHRRFLLARAARSEGLEDEPSLAARLERLRRRELARQRAEQLLLEWVLEDEEALRSYYENNRLRYAEPLRIRLERLEVPFGALEKASDRMARLEAARTEIAAGELAFDTLAQELGGRVESLDWMDFDQLQRIEPRAAELVAPLQAGAVTPPFRGQTSFNMLRVAERREPTPAPLEAVRDQVAEDYLAHHGPRIFEDLAASLLERHDYRVFEDRLAALGTDASTLARSPARSPTRSRDGR